MKKIIKDAIYGAIGGVAGTLVIGQAMGAVSQIQSAKDKQLEKKLLREQPTEKLARQMARNVFGIRLSRDTAAKAGQIVHWGYGTFWGGVYGVLRKRYPRISRAGGMPFGVAFAVFGAAIALPLMKLTPPAHKFPLSAHLRGVVSHHAYAATVEAVTSALEVIERAMTQQPGGKAASGLRRIS